MTYAPESSSPWGGKKDDAATFTQSAGRLAGLAARALGWRPHIFWNATPAELALSLAPIDGGAEPPSRDQIRRMIEKEQGLG